MSTKAVEVENLTWLGSVQEDAFEPEAIFPVELPKPPDFVEEELIYYLDSLDNESVIDAHEARKDFINAAGASNSIVLQNRDYANSIALFKEGTHCSQDIVISFLNEEGYVQNYRSVKVPELALSTIKDLFLNKASEIILNKVPVKRSIVQFFRDNDITKKRCLVKCSDIVHGMALSEKYREFSHMQPNNKKSNNAFSNFTRNDRPAGKLMVQHFIKKYSLSSTPSYREIGEKTGFSFDVYNRQGFLTFSSNELKSVNVTFYRSGFNLFFVKDKYLTAFGKVVPRMKRRIKALSDEQA